MLIMGLHDEYVRAQSSGLRISFVINYSLESVTKVMRLQWSPQGHSTFKPPLAWRLGEVTS